MALIDKYYAYKGKGRLLERMAGACLKAAGDIRTEDPGTTNHANRLLWTADVETDALAKARQMIARTLENATIGPDPEGCTDSDIQVVVNGLIDTFATGA